jgi:alkylation response protein AidB-like acyl-CoA dehydrogenase
VEFDFTEDRLAFRDAVRDLLEKQCSPDVVRAAWDPAGPGCDTALWARLADMGVLGALAPAPAGGLGLSELDLVLVLEESGRAAMPGPLVEHAAVAVPLLAASDAGRQWLEPAAAGRLLVTVDPAGGLAVPWVEEADLAIVLDGDAVYAVESPELGERRHSVDRSMRAGRLSGSPTKGTLLAGADPALGFDRGALGTAAQLLGLGERLIEITVEYAKSRHQFGVPIGSYQAVKHHLANALLKVEYARPCVYRAAYAVAHREPEQSRDVSLAKAYANDAASLAARAALQCHGAIGYTFEYDLHLWMKRVWALRVAWGDTAFHRARIATSVLG